MSLRGTNNFKVRVFFLMLMFAAFEIWLMTMTNRKRGNLNGSRNLRNAEDTFTLLDLNEFRFLSTPINCNRHHHPVSNSYAPTAMHTTANNTRWWKADDAAVTEMLIVVTSHANNYRLRKVLRDAMPTRLLQRLLARRVFLVGIPSPQPHDDDNVHRKPTSHAGSRMLNNEFGGDTSQSSLEEEATLNGDIVQGNFIESYRNLTYKHIMGLTWAVQRCGDVKYVLKMDDDILVDFVQLVQLLRRREAILRNSTSHGERQRTELPDSRSRSSTNNESQPNDAKTRNNDNHLLSGWLLSDARPQRDRAFKWFVSEGEYANATYPPFLSGWAYVTNVHTARRLVQQVTRHAIPPDRVTRLSPRQSKNGPISPEKCNSNRIRNAGEDRDREHVIDSERAGKDDGMMERINSSKRKSYSVEHCSEHLSKSKETPTKYFWIDDVFVTGILAQSVGVRPTHLDDVLLPPIDDNKLANGGERDRSQLKKTYSRERNVSTDDRLRALKLGRTAARKNVKPSKTLTKLDTKQRKTMTKQDVKSIETLTKLDAKHAHRETAIVSPSSLFTVHPSQMQCCVGRHFLCSHVVGPAGDDLRLVQQFYRHVTKCFYEKCPMLDVRSRKRSAEKCVHVKQHFDLPIQGFDGVGSIQRIRV